jgi:ADP-heptose:LPS heptosyltransferase
MNTALSSHWHISLNATGIGDGVCGLYVAEGLLHQGHEVTFYSHQPHWNRFFTKANHQPIHRKPHQCIELSRYDEELAQGKIRKEWYALQVGLPGLQPKTPGYNDIFEEAVAQPREAGEYVLLAPFSNWQNREWNFWHWVGLEKLLEKRGIRCVSLGSSHEASRLYGLSGMRYWGQSPDVVLNLLYHAKAVVGNDSGMVHLAGIFHPKVLAVHSHIGPDRLFSHTQIESIMPQTECTNCGFLGERGYNLQCERNCWALQTLSAFEVMKRLENMLQQPQSILQMA